MSRLRTSVLLGAAALAAYFTFHTVYGRHGLEARSRLLARDAALTAELAVLGAIRERLEGDVALLTQEPADPDLVEEIARSVLGFARSDELFVQLSAPPRLPR